jgi:hypothetical protein
MIDSSQVPDNSNSSVPIKCFSSWQALKEMLNRIALYYMEADSKSFERNQQNKIEKHEV